MVSARIIGIKILPHLRPLTQCGLISPKLASDLVKRYMATGDIRQLTSYIDALNCPEETIALKSYVIGKVTEEETKWKNACA